MTLLRGDDERLRDLECPVLGRALQLESVGPRWEALLRLGRERERARLLARHGHPADSELAALDRGSPSLGNAREREEDVLVPAAPVRDREVQTNVLAHRDQQLGVLGDQGNPAIGPVGLGSGVLGRADGRRREEEDERGDTRGKRHPIKKVWSALRHRIHPPGPSQAKLG